mmetsp:Transcript_17747/g.49661  ORF Transcript_17747/g.49661 Transcript_17747/m.49661 type:complete len:233 (-) Transcript_17747:67-765(-)
MVGTTVLISISFAEHLNVQHRITKLPPRSQKVLHPRGIAVGERHPNAVLRRAPNLVTHLRPVAPFHEEDIMMVVGIVARHRLLVAIFIKTHHVDLIAGDSHLLPCKPLLDIVGKGDGVLEFVVHLGILQLDGLRVDFERLSAVGPVHSIGMHSVCDLVAGGPVCLGKSCLGAGIELGDDVGAGPSVRRHCPQQEADAEKSSGGGSTHGCDGWSETYASVESDKRNFTARPLF